MKVNYLGKRYDTEKLKIIAEQDVRNYSNNCVGGEFIGVASDGTLIQFSTSNGDDVFRSEGAEVMSAAEVRHLLSGTDWEVNEEVAANAGILEIVK